MAHHQRAVATAVALNTGIFGVELIAGWQASSLSLVMDGVHNFSDQLAMVAIWLAFIAPRGPSRTLLRGANLLNSVGLIAVSCVLLWQAYERFFNPVPVSGIVPIAVGLAAAAGNYGVARLLREPGQHNAAIRLAYIHNLGDVWVSLAPVLAGFLVLATGYHFFDTLIAAAVAVWFMVSTGREVLESHDQLIWPDKIVCCHTDSERHSSISAS